jgi:Uma2 family endonuclease
MSSFPAHRPLLSVAEYLAGEESAEVRHEYLAGEIYAMTGASARHNRICLNLGAALLRQLRGSPCQVFMVDLKVHLRVNSDDYFYYPDLMVACRADDAASHYREHPRVIIEVLSESTERIDRREKFFAYQQIAALEEYVLVAQDRPEATVFRRAAGWAATRLGEGDTLELASLDFRLALNEVFDGVPE